ncbi:MAG TPA: hypothetical protein VLA55_00205, partial [Ornithinibacter sp.]|nr:hypothetical protein [Ornithinibacter sp.]
ASAWGIRVGRLGIDASSSGELWVDSSGNTSGASSNTTAPITATLGAARTTDGPVHAASALGFGRVDTLTEAILASSGGEVLTLTTATDARVSAWSSDHSTVSADAAAAALGTAVAVVLPTLASRASLDGAVVVDGGVMSLGASLTDDSSSGAVGGREGALAAVVGRRSSTAGLAEGAALSGSLDDLRLTATSTTGARGAATASGPASESLVVVVADSATVAGLANGATVGGVENLTVAANGSDTTTATAGTPRGLAVVLSTATTGARLGTGEALVLDGDLTLSALQSATAQATAALVALTLATHDVSATVGRAVTAGGSVSARATGWSQSFASTPAAGSGALAGTSLAEALLVRGLADALAAASGARGSSPLPGLSPAPMTLGSVAVTVVRGSAVVELPALPVRAGGAIDLVAVSGGSGAAGTGAPRDGGATGGPAVSIVLAILPSKVRVPGPVQTDEDLLLQAGRGPPALESAPAPHDPTSIRIIHRPSTVEIIGPVTLTGTGATLTVLQDTTAPVEAPGLPQQAPPQDLPSAPPPGSVFVSAATGGTVTTGRATLTFAPGSLPTDAWVVIHLDRRAVRGLLTTSLVYDLLAFDARTGAAITSFRVDPVLSIAVDGATSGQRIVYIAPDGSLEVMPTVTGAGTVTAALPHFSPFAAGSPLDGLVGAIVPLLQQYLADALSGTRTETLDDLDLGVLVIESPTISFGGITGSSGAYTTSVDVSGLVRIELVVGSRRVAGTATLSGTYAVAAAALDAGTFSLTLSDLALTVADVLTLTATSAVFAQVGDDVTVTASAATATLAAPGGPALTVTATDLDLLIRDDGLVAFRLSGATAALTGIPQVSATSTGTWTLAYNGTGEQLSIGGVDLAAELDIEASGGATITAAGQSLTATTLTVTRAGQALSLAATGVGLVLAVGATTVVTVSGASGTLVVDDTGAAGTVTGTVSGSALGLVSLSADTASVAVNTRSTAAAGLPAGPYVRVVVESVTLTLGSLGQLDGSVSFERQTGTGGAPVLVVALTGVTATAGTSTVLLTDGTGLLVSQGSGVAGFLSGTVGAGAGTGFAVGADALLRLNTTGGGVEQSVTLDGRTIAVTFSAGEAQANPGGIFSLSLTGLVLDIGVATIKGDVTFGTGTAGDVFAGRGLSLFVGVGPAWLADGSLNPLARGLLVTGATIGLVRTGSGASALYALSAIGAVQLVGLSGLTLGGTLSVRSNTLGTMVDESITVPGGDPVVVSFVAGEGDAEDFVAIGGSLTLTVLGQSLTGAFTFTPTEDGFTVGAEGVAFSVVPSGASTPVAALSGGTAQLVVSSTGVAGRVTGDVALTVPGVSLTTGTFELLVNTTGATVAGPFGPVDDLPAGPYLRLLAAGATLTIGSQQVSGTFGIEQVSSGGTSTTTRLTLSGGSLQVGAGTFVLSGVVGTLTLGASGVAGELAATVTTTVPGLALSGAVSVAVNTASTPVQGLPAGPYVRVVLLGATLTVSSQTLTADLAVERSTTFGDDGVPGGTGDDADSTVARIAVSRASFAVPGTAPLVRLTNGTGTLLVIDGEVAGRLAGTLAVSVPGVRLTGSFVVELNTGSADVDETIDLGGLTLSLVVPGGPYVRVSGTDVVLEVLGQELRGDVVIAQGTTDTEITVTGADLSLAGGLARITGASATLVISPTGVVGSFLGTVTLDVPQVSLTGTVSAEIDTAAGTVRIGGTAVVLTVAGQSLSGTIWLERTLAANGAPVVTVTLGAATLAIGTYVAVTITAGTLVIADDGVAGAFSANAAFALPGGLTLPDAAVRIDVNTRPDAVVLTSPSVTLPAGPYVRVEVTITAGAPLAVGTLGSLSGTFAFQRSPVAGSDPVVVLAVTDGAATLGSGGTGGGVTSATGAFVLAGWGLAGYLAGDADATLPGFSLGASVLLRVNTTGAAVDEVISVGRRDLPVTFASGESVFSISVTGGTLTIGGVVTITGDFTAGPTEFAGRNLTVFVGDGPAFLEDGSRNPLARGVLITDAVVGFAVVGGLYGLDVRGTVELVGFAGVTLSGTIRARVNERTVAWTETITFPDGTGDVVIAFTDGTGGTSDERAVGSTPFVAVTGVDLQVSVLGQTFSGDLSFARTAAGLTVTAENVTLVLRDGATAIASLTEGAGEIQLGSSGVAAVISGTVALTLPGVAVSGAITLAVNTTGSSVAFDAAGTTLDATLPAGPYLRLTGTDIDLTLAALTVTDAELEIERRTEGGAPVTRVTLSGGGLSVGDGTTAYLTLTDVRGMVVAGAGGIAGRLDATVGTLAIPGLTVTSLSLAVNTGATAVGDLPAGPYLRVELAGAALTVAGQTLTADLAFERTLTTAGTPVVRAAVTNLALVLTSGGQPVASLTDGTGALLLTSTGMAARFTGSLVLTIPGVSLTGTLSLELNSTGGEVNEVVPVAGGEVLLALPDPGSATAYVRFVGTDITLLVLGQSLRGNLTIESSSGTTHLLVTDAELDLGDGLVRVTGASADLTVGPGGAHGSFAGTVAFTAPNVSLSGSLSVEVDTRAATRHLRVVGTDVLLTVAGQVLRADVSFEQATTAGGETVVKVAIASTAGHPLLSLTAGGSDVLVVTAATGQLLLTSAGIAGSLVVTTFALTIPGGTTLTADVLRVDVSTVRAPVTETFVLGGTSTVLTLPAGPYVSVRVIGGALTLGGGAELAGNFALEQRADASGAAVTVIAASDVEVAVTIGTDGARLTDGEGVFVILPNGLAGYLSGRADLAAGPVSAGADILLRVNTSSGPVDTSIELAGRTLVVKFDEGDVFEVSVSGLSLTIADFLTIEGDVSFSDTTINGQAAQVFAGEGLTIFLGRGPAKLSTGETNPLAIGVLLTNGRIGLVKIGSTYALVAEGTVSLIGVAGVVITGTVTARVNTTGGAVNENLSVPGSTGPGIGLTFADGSVVTALVASGATLQVAGQSLTGTFSFDRSADGDLVVAASGVSVALGGAVSVTNASGILVSGAAGMAGRLAGTVVLTVPGVGLAGTFAVSVNTTAAPVQRLVDLGDTVLALDLPTGPYLRVEATGVTVTLVGQSLSADVLIERRTTAGGMPVTVLALSRLDLALGAGPYGARITGGSGLLVVGATGVAGRVGGTVAVTLPAGTSLSGALSLAVNTGTTPVSTSAVLGGTTLTLDLPAGPYLRLEGTGLVLTVLGQTITGSVGVERATSYGNDGVPGGTGLAADSSVVRITVTSATLALGGATPVVTVTDGTATLILTPAGLAGRISGTVGLHVPGLTFSGTLGVEVNTTSALVNETFTVGSGAPVVLALPVGPYLRLTGTGIDLTVAGQTLRGDLEITRTVDAAGAPVVRLAVRGATLRLGGTAATPILTVTQTADTTAELLLTSAGTAGRLSVGITLAVPGVSITGTVGLDLNTTPSAVVLGGATLPAGPYLRVSGTGILIQVLGQSLAADVTFEQATTSTGATVVRLGIANASLSLVGDVTASVPTSPAVGFRNGTGLFVLTPGGLAGSLGVDVVLAVGDAFSLTGALSLQVNTTTIAVAQSLVVGGTVVAIDVPAGPYLRLAGDDVVLVVAGQRVSADVALERVTT